MKAYFNSSREQRRADWERRCTHPGAVNATCVVPDQKGPPGGDAAGTWFFSGGANMTANQTVFGGKKSQAVGAGVEVGGLVLVVAVLLVVGFLGELG